ncbi:T9SS type A sorting domain-containing protein [Hymenobacter cellulosivorans]|uniref:T9SS type A sorting domain-containing protein n=1 Tax=Hymenobacter cellulosivorans TaxID=2932249 RepID=A0ABY4F7H4_9BACT|nr:T9SS type A sorting domain-containing protein [Hymenobacter cellulosivorans]UOQ51869.1 T9SS type A sorting domain-containing protein [Hymenobacter cellulosivorans]
MIKTLPQLFLGLTLLFAGSSAHQALAQGPVKQWDKTYGGTLEDRPLAVVLTPDGGSIIGGQSYSDAGGDKTQSSTDTDYWILRLDASGNKIWDRTFGTFGNDMFTTLEATADGGFLLGGTTNTAVSGDKTQAGPGGTDFWVIKLDANGTKLWDRVYGSTGPDALTAMVRTPDGGFLLGGTSGAGVSGNKTQPGKGDNDYWVIKIDAAGNKLWDQVYGGTFYDNLSTMVATQDGGAILAGTSGSVLGADKTEANQGGSDYWVVKIDAAGTKQWDRTLGGTDDDQATGIRQALDGGYIVAGSSISGQGGNKTQPSRGGRDMWLIKLNANGTKQWDRTFGGIATEEPASVVATNDGGFLAAGYSNSNISGDKTQNIIGLSDVWMIKIDANGIKQWDRTMGGTKLDYLLTFQAMQVAPDGSLLLAVFSESNSGFDKTQSSKGLQDYWIIKLGNVTTATAAPVAGQVLQAYPNPATRQLTVRLGNGAPRTNLRLSLLDATGRTVYSQRVTATGEAEVPLTLREHPAGLYLLRLEGPEGYVATQRLQLN